MRLYILLMGVFVILTSSHANAAQQSARMSGDPRIRTYVYDPNDVFVWKGHLRYQSSIEFSPSESIQSVSVGDSTSWQIVPAGSRMFLKPIAFDATTNMTVITNQRIYHFELYAEEAEDIRAEDMVFQVRFVYPDSQGVQANIINLDTEDIPDIEEEPEKYNFNYSISGDRLIAPLKVFDDGEFTYMEFRDKNAEIPAIFMVNNRGEESLINYRITGQYLVVEMVGQVLTLRKGEMVTCVFNEANPFKEIKKERKRLFGIF